MKHLHSKFPFALVFPFLLTSTPAFGAVLLFDDFESYAPGSNLINQGGWESGFAGTSSVIVDDGANPEGIGLPGLVVNGRVNRGNGFGRTTHALAGSVNPFGITTMTVDAYYFTGPGVGTHNSETSLGGSLFEVTWTSAGVSNPCQGWGFGNTAIFGAACYEGADAKDTPVTLVTQIDGENEIIYGQILDANDSILFETEHFALSRNLISTLDTAIIEIDIRSRYRGAQYDNIMVTTTDVPEPSSLLMLGTVSILGISGFGLKHRKKQ